MGQLLRSPPVTEEPHAACLRNPGGPAGSHVKMHPRFGASTGRRVRKREATRIKPRFQLV